MSHFQNNVFYWFIISGCVDLCVLSVILELKLKTHFNLRNFNQQIKKNSVGL